MDNRLHDLRDRYGLSLNQPDDRALTERSPRRRLPVVRMLLAAMLVAVAAGGAYPLLPRSYIAYSTILIRPTGQGGDAEFTPTARNALDDNAVQTKMDILASVPLQRAVMDDNDLLNDGDFNVRLKPPGLIRQVVDYLFPHPSNDIVEVEARLVRKLDVRREKHSYVLRVGYETTSAEKSTRLSNTLAKAFIGDGVEQKRKLYDNVLGGMQRRVIILQKLYQDVELRQHAFLLSSGLIHRSETESLQRQLAALSQDLAIAHSATVAASDRATMLAAAQRTNTLDSISEGLNSPLLQHIRERLIGMTTGAGYGSGNAPAGGSEAVITALKAAITTELLHIVRSGQNDAQVVQANETALQDAINHLDERLTARQASERELDLLNRRVDAARAALVDAMTRYDQQAHREFQSDVELVSLAVPPIRPSFPNLLIYLGGTIMLAFSAAILPILPRLLRLPAR